MNLTKLSEKDLDEDDFKLPKSSTVTTLEEANKDLTKKHESLGKTLHDEIKLRKIVNLKLKFMK